MKKIAVITLMTTLQGFSAAGHAQDNNDPAGSGFNAELKVEENITDADIRDYLEVREKYKDDPETLELLDEVQKAAGITEQDIARAQGKNVPDTTQQDRAAEEIEPDPQTAEQAYRSGDYETALKHYEALAAEGDGYANLMLGLMYHQGQGVDGDKSKAQAYYERAADLGEQRGNELSQSLEYELSPADQERARETYSELREKQQTGATPSRPAE